MMKVGVACFKCHFAWYKVHRDEMTFAVWCKRRLDEPPFREVTDVDRDAVAEFFVCGPWDMSAFKLKDFGFKIFQDLKMVRPAKLDTILEEEALLKFL